MATNKPKTKMGRPTKEQKQLKDAQKLSRDELESNIRMFKAIKEKDADVLAEFNIDVDKVTVKQQMDAAKELVKLSTQHLKDIESISDEEFEKVKNSGVCVAHFQTTAKLNQPNYYENRKQLRVVNG